MCIMLYFVLYIVYQEDINLYSKDISRSHCVKKLSMEIIEKQIFLRTLLRKLHNKYTLYR